MAMYGVATLPIAYTCPERTRIAKMVLIRRQRSRRLEDLLLFYKQLTELGRYFGYTFNALKRQIIVKEASEI